MSDALVGLNSKIPKEIHEKAKRDAKEAGLSLKDYIISLIECGGNGGGQEAGGNLLALLSQRRSSEQFGDETILEEILRRVVSLQSLNADLLVQKDGPEVARKTIKRLDGVTQKIIDQR